MTVRSHSFPNRQDRRVPTFQRFAESSLVGVLLFVLPPPSLNYQHIQQNPTLRIAMASITSMNASPINHPVNRVGSLPWPQRVAALEVYVRDLRQKAADWDFMAAGDATAEAWREVGKAIYVSCMPFRSYRHNSSCVDRHTRTRRRPLSIIPLGTESAGRWTSTAAGRSSTTAWRVDSSRWD